MTRVKEHDRGLVLAKMFASPGIASEKFEGYKGVSKLVSGTTNFACARLEAAEKVAPVALKNTATVFKHITGVLCLFELAIRLKELAVGDSEGKRPWQKGSAAESGTHTVAFFAKTGKNASEVTRWGITIAETTSPIMLKIAKWLGPIANIFEMINAIFSSIANGIKIFFSKRKVEKYENRATEWSNRLTVDHKTYKNGADRKGWDTADADVVVEDMRALACKKLYGKKSFAQHEDRYSDQYDENLEEVSKAGKDQAETAKFEKAKGKLEKSLNYRLNDAVNKLTVDVISKKLYDKFKEDFEFKHDDEVKSKEAILAKLKEELVKYLTSSQKKVAPYTFLADAIENSKAVAAFVKSQEKNHLKFRKWEKLLDYADGNAEAKVKATTFKDYAKAKIADKEMEVKEQKKAQTKAWVNIAFMIAVFILAAVSFALAVSPLNFVALPIVTFSLVAAVNVLSLTKFLVGEFIKPKSKLQMDFLAKLPSLRPVHA